MTALAWLAFIALFYALVVLGALGLCRAARIGDRQLGIGRDDP